MGTRNVVVIDYGIGNVFSVLMALERVGVRGNLTSDPDKIAAADRVILPGVGAFGRAAYKLRSMGLEDAIRAYVSTGKPFLGICVGMQLLMERGEEFGEHRGLGFIPGSVRQIRPPTDAGAQSKIPLIGWFPVEEAKPGAWSGSPFSAVSENPAFYFVHSFQAEVENPDHRIACHRLGDEAITSAVRHENVLGVQFHPERSAGTGHAFLRAFVETD